MEEGIINERLTHASKLLDTANIFKYSSSIGQLGDIKVPESSVSTRKFKYVECVIQCLNIPFMVYVIVLSSMHDEKGDSYHCQSPFTLLDEVWGCCVLFSQLALILPISWKISIGRWANNDKRANVYYLFIYNSGLAFIVILSTILPLLDIATKCQAGMKGSLIALSSMAFIAAILKGIFFYCRRDYWLDDSEFYQPVK